MNRRNPPEFQPACEHLEVRSLLSHLSPASTDSGMGKDPIRPDMERPASPVRGARQAVGIVPVKPVSTVEAGTSPVQGIPTLRQPKALDPTLVDAALVDLARTRRSSSSLFEWLRSFTHKRSSHAPKTGMR